MANSTLTAITGAGGFVGLNLVEALLAEGRPIRALAYQKEDQERLAKYPIEQVEGDITNRDSLIAAFQGVDVVYHLAGLITLTSNAELAHRINVEGVRNVLEACRAAGVRRLVHVSSFHVHLQTPFDQPLTEQSPFVDENTPLVYPRTKAAGEKLVHEAVQAGLDAVIIRPTGILGPNDYQPSIFGTALIDMAQGKFPILVQGVCNWVDVRDVAKGALLAEKHGKCGEAYLISGHFASVRTIAEEMARLGGIRPPLAYLPMAFVEPLVPVVGLWAKLTGTTPRLTATSLDALKANPNISFARAEADLGYQPRPLEETLRDVHQWFKSQGRLR